MPDICDDPPPDKIDACACKASMEELVSANDKVEQAQDVLDDWMRRFSSYYARWRDEYKRLNSGTASPHPNTGLIAGKEPGFDVTKSKYFNKGSGNGADVLAWGLFQAGQLEGNPGGDTIKKDMVYGFPDNNVGYICRDAFVEQNDSNDGHDGPSCAHFYPNLCKENDDC